MFQLYRFYTTFVVALRLFAVVLIASFAASPSFAQTFPICSSSAVDQDNDGYGWENSQTCVVSGSGAAVDNGVQAPVSSSFPICSSPNSADGFGWGWENNASCVVSGSGAAALVGATGTAVNNTAQNNTVVQSTTTDTGVPVCQSAASDLDFDGWGFESGRSCQVTAASQAGTSNSVVTPGVAPPPVAAATAGYQNGQPICLTDASDAGNNGFGYENNSTCVVVPGVTATRFQPQPMIGKRSCIPWLEIGYGNYKLQNNTWNSSAVYHNNWSQCIELTGGPGNYVAKWDYNWLDRTQGNDFAVKSYPQVYIGRKTQYNLSGTVAETGMPVRIDSMPQFWVEYDYSETGIVERNVALESFFHNSCDAEEYNKQFEMMVWVGKPTIRTPGTLATTVTLSGRDWEVYTNPALGWAYVAFVAVEPHNSGTLNWNEFVYWSRDVGPSFGVPWMNAGGCMGAIEIGTETFWGTGTFSLNKFRVNGQ